MNVKEIRKAIGKLRLTQEFMRRSHKKGAVSKLQMEINDKRG